MIITPARSEPTQRERLRRPKTSHPLLPEDGEHSSSLLLEVPDFLCVVPPPPQAFKPNSKMLLLATQKRLASHDRSKRPTTAKSKLRISRRRVKSATSRSEASDDETNMSQTTESEWNWLSEPFDFDADPEGDESVTVAPQKKDIHSVEVYKAACQKLGEVPSQVVCRHMIGRDLVLKNSYIEENGAKAIAIGLVVNGSIENVDLGGNNFGAKGVSYICEALQENNFISELRLANNKLKSAGVDTVCRSLSRSDTLKVLDLSGNELEDFDAVHIANFLRENKALKELNISHNALRERGGMILGYALGENKTLEKLDASWNHLRRKGAMVMCECLRKNKGLKILNLKWNGLYLDGCRALKRSLPENKTLVELDISNNRIDEECLKELMIGMRRNGTCTTLKMANSPMPVEACLTFLETFMKYPDMALEEIDMTNQPVNIAFIRKYDSLRQMKRIKIIHGVLAPAYLQLDAGEQASDIFINDDPMIVLMEYMRLQNLRLLDLFSSLDTDKSQSLSREEFRTGLLQANIPLSSACLDKLIKSLDADGDGEVDYNELLEGLKAHKKKVAKIMQRQKHLKFEDTDIGKVNIKINALLQFRMMFHKISLAKNKTEQEAMETTLQEYQDKLSDLSSMKRNMLQAGMERARVQALERRNSRIASPKMRSVAEQVGIKPKLTAKLSAPMTDSGHSEGKSRRFSQMARALSAPVRKK